MSFRRFSLFSSNTNIKTRRDSARSTQAPTYRSNATLPPIYMPNESMIGNANNCVERSSSGNLPSASSVASLGSDTLFEPSLTRTDSVGQMAVEITGPAGPRYVYYRVYAEDGVVPAMNPVYSDDPHLGRIMANLVAPPHTAFSLKRCLLNIENIDKSIPARLFISASSQSPMDDAGRVSIAMYPGPGCTPSDPMVLVAGFSCADRSSLVTATPEPVLLSSQEGPTPFNPQYLYYRVYKDSVAVRSMRPANLNDPSVGRLNIDSIPPPHTATSIKRCISQLEELDNWEEWQLFINILSESPMGNEHISLLTSDHPGSTPDDSMAIVSDVVPAAGPALSQVPPVPYQKWMRVKYPLEPGKHNPKWLSITEDERLCINHGKPQMQLYKHDAWKSKDCLVYEAVNAAGEVGFVHEYRVIEESVLSAE